MEIKAEDTKENRPDELLSEEEKDAEENAPDGEASSSEKCAENSCSESEKDSENDPQEETTALNKRISKKSGRKYALRFVIALLILLAVGIPLALVDFNDLFSTMPPEREIEYFEENYEENIWKNAEYLELLPTTVTINVNGGEGYVYYYKDFSSAETAFSEIAVYESGGKVLADYFLCMLRGGTSTKDVSRYKALFAEGSAVPVPEMFPAQKVYNIKLLLESTSADASTQTRTAVWKVSFDVLYNDGSVLNYTGARDGGDAHFTLKQKAGGGEYLIGSIEGIQYVN